MAAAPQSPPLLRFYVQVLYRGAATEAALKRQVALKLCDSNNEPTFLSTVSQNGGVELAVELLQMDPNFAIIDGDSVCLVPEFVFVTGKEALRLLVGCVFNPLISPQSWALNELGNIIVHNQVMEALLPDLFSVDVAEAGTFLRDQVRSRLSPPK